MSGRNRRYQQRRRFPWVILALGGILFVGAALFLIRQSSDGSGTPAITADPSTIEYGFVHFGENRSFAITVTNTGDGTLRFKGKPYVEVLEGC